MKKNISISLTIACLVVLLPCAKASPLASSFTYQGRLYDGFNTNTTGSYMFRFSLFDSQTFGNQIGLTVVVTNVAVSDGFFTVGLDFGNGVFTNAARWLSIDVATNIGGVFSTLAPRQNVSASPFALYSVSSGSISSPIDASQIAANSVVKSINGLKDVVNLVAGANATVTQDTNSNLITISTSGGGAWPNNLSEYANAGLYSITNLNSTRMSVELWGAGGGGGGGGGSGSCGSFFYSGGAGGNGGAGGYCRAIVTLTPGLIYKIRVGVGGAGGAGGFTNPNVSGTPGQPGQVGQDTTVEDAIGNVIFRSSGGQGGGRGVGGVCNVSSQNTGTNGAAGSGDINAPIKRVGYTIGSMTPSGVIGGTGSNAGLAPAAGSSGGNGYALIMW